jgi:hypothetical protein
MFISFILGTILIMPAFFLVPLLIKDFFGGGAAHLGLFQAVQGFAGIIGSLILYENKIRLDST